MALPITHFISGSAPSLELVYSDVWLPGIYSRRILCFKLPESSSYERAIDCLHRGLQSLVNGTPELGGQVVVLPVDDERNNQTVPWKAIGPHKGIEFRVKDFRKDILSYDELEKNEFPITAFRDDLLVPVALAIQPEPNAEMIVQASLIEGGLLLAVCLCHSLTDGNGMNAITVALAEQCQLAARVQGMLEPRAMNTDRKVMLGLTGSKKKLSDHPMYGRRENAFVPQAAVSNDDVETKLPIAEDLATTLIDSEPSDTAPTSGSASTPAPAKVHTYRVSSAAASALKLSASTAGRISTHDAIAALMWRTLIVARYKAGRVSADKISTYTFPHNSRRHVGLPKNWVGNCCYFVGASLPISTILEADSLPVMASAIRAGLNAVNQDVVGGLMELRKPCTYDITWWPLGEIDEPRILMMTSLYHSELFGVDFGGSLGTVKHFGTSDAGVMGGFTSVGLVGAKMEGGGCDVSLGFDEEEGRSVKEDQYWWKFMIEMGS